MHTFRTLQGLAVALCAGWALFACGAQCHAREFTLASWNMNNLHEQSGYAWRKGAPVREDADFQLLQHYAGRLQADIVALQEVNSALAVARVFPDSEYEIHLSGRRQDRADHSMQTDGIYLAFAVRRGRFDKVLARDVPALGAVSEHPLRWGLELSVTLGGETFSILNVHLKSGCFSYSLETPASEACEILARQRAPLETWIDELAAAGTPFAVVGDFNRAFGVHGQKDHMWRDIDDGDPAGLSLHRLPDHQANLCWAGTRRHHRNAIDFLVFDALAWQWVDSKTFRQLDYDPKDRDPVRALPSDHCPVSVRLVIPDRRASP